MLFWINNVIRLESLLAARSDYFNSAYDRIESEIYHKVFRLFFDIKDSQAPQALVMQTRKWHFSEKKISVVLHQ